MEDQSKLASIFFDDGKRIVPRIALMDDCIQAKFDGQAKLLFKQTSLHRLARAIQRIRLDGAFGVTPQRSAREAMVIQPDFADGGYARQPRHLTQCVDRAFRRGFCRIGMNSDGGINARVFASQGRRPCAPFDGSADGYDPVNAGGGSARNEIGHFTRKIGKIEMRVGIGKHGVAAASGAHAEKVPEDTFALANAKKKGERNWKRSFASQIDSATRFQSHPSRLNRKSMLLRKISKGPHGICSLNPEPPCRPSKAPRSI